MGKTFVIGDIHGAHIPLKQCLERSKFNRVNDTLITIGDICDGWPYVFECVEELLTIKNRIDIRGNHDQWFYYWLKTGIHPDNWRQGGSGTKKSYLRFKLRDDQLLNEESFYLPSIKPNEIPDHHCLFFDRQINYYKDKMNRVFVHGGFYRFQTLKKTEETNEAAFYWDRDLWEEALEAPIDEPLKFKEKVSEIFIGHMQTCFWTKNERKWGSLILPGGEPIMAPMKADIIYNIDTGAGSIGKLTIMDVDTHEYWQSDKVNDIYGNYNPRG